MLPAVTGFVSTFDSAKPRSRLANCESEIPSGVSVSCVICCCRAHDVGLRSAEVWGGRLARGRRLFNGRGSWSVQRGKNFSCGAGGSSRPDLYTKTLCASYVGRSSVSDARSIRRQGGVQHWSRSTFTKNLRVVGSGFYESAIRLRQGVGGVQDVEGKFGQDFLRSNGGRVPRG